MAQTFASMAKAIRKRFEGRENDAPAMRTMEAQLTALMEENEAIRIGAEEKEARMAEGARRWGGKIKYSKGGKLSVASADKSSLESQARAEGMSSSMYLNAMNKAAKTKYGDGGKLVAGSTMSQHYDMGGSLSETNRKFREGGNTNSDVPPSRNFEGTSMTPQLEDMTKTLMDIYGWTEQNALMGASVAYKETMGVAKRENSYYNTSVKSIKRIFKDNKFIQNASTATIQKLLDQADANQSTAFFNEVYAGIGGNGNAASGDGDRYRGIGIVQFTGKDNIKAASKSLFGDER